ncbi:MAG: efflux RND transporter periplasmic adaptor subunit [Verrucomicrobiota bacterium]
MSNCAQVILATLLSLPLQATDAPKPMEVKTSKPARGEIVRYVTIPGTIKANQQATLYAKTAGYLKRIAVDKGDRVKAGVLIAEIESPELESELIRSRAEVVRAKAETVRTSAELEIAQLMSNRMKQAQQQSSDLVTPQSVDEAKARLASAQANCEVSKANEAVTQANVTRLETLLAYTRITAPFDGVVTGRSVDPGAFIPAATSGSAAQSAAMVTVMEFSTVRIQVAMPEVESVLVREGQPVKTTVEALPSRVFESKVSRIAGALDEATRTMLIEADLPNPQHELRPGMYATVKVGVEKHTAALLVPAEALVMEKANAFVFLNAGGKAHKTAIQIGFNDGNKVEVLSGLSGTEPVLLVGKLPITDGSPINAIEAQ